MQCDHRRAVIDLIDDDRSINGGGKVARRLKPGMIRMSR
jgi:hypothetical protein